MDYFQEEEASKEEVKRYSSPQWTRWKTYMVWEKLHAIWRNQGSRPSRTLGNAFKILCIEQFEARSRERLAIFLNKRGRIQSFSTTHDLRLALRKWYVWRHGMSSTKGFAYSDSATCRTKIELAIWSTRSTKPRRKIILGTIKRFEKFQGNLEQHRGLQNIWSTSFCSRAASHNTWEHGQEVDR